MILATKLQWVPSAWAGACAALIGLAGVVLITLAPITKARAQTQVQTPVQSGEYADPRRKLALIIGFNGYAGELALFNSIADATLVGDRLALAGFSVTRAIDARKTDLSATVDTFLTAAADADLALVYYAGHAVQIDGLNFMVPVDFDPAKPDIVNQLYGIDDLLKSLRQKTKTQVLLLDACRDNPFAGTIASLLKKNVIGTGLAPIHMPIVEGRADVARGLVVGYATQPNTTALDGNNGHGPYALALADGLANPDEDLSAILLRTARQVVNGSRGRQHPEHRVAATAPVFLVSRKEPFACDVLAAEEDNNVSVKGIAFDLIDVAKAEPACRADLARYPGNFRLMHNLARTLDKAGRFTEAVDLYHRAAEAGFDWSQNNLAVLLLEGRGATADVKEALVWFRRAYAQGNRQAIVNFTGYNLTRDLTGRPAKILALQKALQKVGAAGTPLSAVMDKATLDAVDTVKRQAKFVGTGITFQLIDHLDLADAIFKSPRNKT
jgi:tetratricopeptide (TPR) repeat protein